MKWTTEAMLGVQAIRDVQVSPEGNRVLFAVVEARMKDDLDQFVSHIYLTNMGESAQILSPSDQSCSQPRWSPDGKWVAFLAEVNKVKQLHLMPVTGGPSSVLVASAKDVQNFRWSPDGRTIAFVMEEALKFDKPACDAYFYGTVTSVNRLWVIDVAEPLKARSLTEDDYHVKGVGEFGTFYEEFDWSPDGRKLAFTFSLEPGANSFAVASNIGIVDLGSGAVQTLDKRSPLQTSPRYSPDGKAIAFMMRDGSHIFANTMRIATVASDGTAFRLLSATPNGGPFFIGPSIIGWTSDNQEIILFEPKRTKYSLVAILANGESVRTIDTGEYFFQQPALNAGSEMLGMVIEAPDRAPEAFVTSLSEFVPVRVSKVNESYAQYPIGRTVTIQWKSTDGTPIEGLLTYPVDYQEGRRYPLLVNVHGGPAAFFSETYLGTPWAYPLSIFSQEGYLILRPNPRGSTGYGRAFRVANYRDWGGGDFEDIMSGVNALLDQGIADSERLGILGFSYGGYMTAWAITQTTRFKAASMAAGIANLTSMLDTSDLTSFIVDYFEGDLWQEPELYWQRSPLMYANQVTTPLLIQHGNEDKRVPISQAYEFYHALRRAGQQPTLVVYPRMGHRFPEPKMTKDLLERNADWFRLHLKSDSVGDNAHSEALSVT